MAELLELNDVLVEGERQTISLMARRNQLTCITGGTQMRRTRLLYAMMGLAEVRAGYVSIDGEPLSTATAADFRSNMAFAPDGLRSVGHINVYEPPSVQDVFLLKANRQLPISNGILTEEMKRIAPITADNRNHLQWLAVAVLRGCPILLADNPPIEAAAYLLQHARKGHIVIATSSDAGVLCVADAVTELM